MSATMPWHRVEEVSEYRLNTKKLDEWLKSKWGNYDYEIEVGFRRYGGIQSCSASGRPVDIAGEKYNNGLYSFWSLEPKTEVGRVATLITRRLMIRMTGIDG
jgi:hypothetical protein